MRKYIYYYIGRHGNKQYIKDHIWTAFIGVYRLEITPKKEDAKQYPEDSSVHGSGLFKCLTREEITTPKFVIKCGSHYLFFGNVITTCFESTATRFNCKEDAANFLAKAAIAGFTGLSIGEVND